MIMLVCQRMKGDLEKIAFTYLLKIAINTHENVYFSVFFSGIIQTAILTILKDSTITEEEVKLKSSQRKKR